MGLIILAYLGLSSPDIWAYYSQPMVDFYTELGPDLFARIRSFGADGWRMSSVAPMAFPNMWIAQMRLWKRCHDPLSFGHIHSPSFGKGYGDS